MKALVLDDEPPARRELCRQLRKFGVTEVFEAHSVKAAVDILSEQKVDVLFLDIEMPKGGGFELLAKQPAQNIPAIFVTAHAEHAVRAFDWQATDYLLKPVSEERLLAALGRLKSSAAETKFRANEKVIFRDAGKNHFLRLGDIKLLESAGAYTRVVHTGGSLTVNGTLSRLLARIDENLFVRANRTQAVNPEHIVKIGE
ncbi:MAG: response regulator transcription factor, partial [Chthoniobacterales bacterium]|nr:response regulator transcription factor [Chthoniobacterales bacterium]